jgi:hypothetical protein
MAIGTVTAAQAATGKPVHGHGFGGNAKVAWGTYNIAAATADGDIIQLCRVPAGATVVGGWLIGQDIDTGTETWDADFGWAANGDEVGNPAGFGNFGVISGDAIDGNEAGIFRMLGGVIRSAGPKTFNAETVLQLEVNAAANATGTGQITVIVFYVMP